MPCLHGQPFDEHLHRDDSRDGIISMKAMSSARTIIVKRGCLQTHLTITVRIGRMPVNEESEVFRVDTADMVQ